MKQISIAFLLIIGSIYSYSQPVLENVYSNSVNICMLEVSGNMYYAMDITNKQCKIYNMDHSIYKTISLAVPDNYYLYNIQFVSEHLFNRDDLFELVYTYSMYIPTETSYYYTYETRLINENGTEILKVPGAGYTDVIQTSGSGKKFMVYVYDFSVFPASYQTRVYSLPETDTKAGVIIVQDYSPGQPFPNPSEGSISLPVMLPDGLPSGTFRLFDNMGRMLRSMPIDQQLQNLDFPPGSLVPGTYYYRIESGSYQSETKKIIIR